MSKLLVVLGATGNQGGSVCMTYINKPEWKVRAITRDCSKPAAKKLEAQGAEVVAADLNDVESLKAAFEGANMVFAVTDFWAPFFNPATQSKLRPGQSINQYCYELEVTHGKNIAAALAPQAPTLDLLVWSSLVDTEKWSQGKYTWIYHFNSKAHIYNHIRDAYPSLAAKTSQLFMGSYMDNLKTSPIHSPRRQPDGSYVLAWPQSPATLEPFVDTPRDTGKFVEALQRLGAGRKLFGVSDLRTGEELMRIWCGVVGVRGRYQQVPIEELRAMIPNQDFGREVAESRGFNAEFGWNGGEDDVVMPKDLGIETTSLEEYLHREGWSITGESKRKL